MKKQHEQAPELTSDNTALSHLGGTEFLDNGPDVQAAVEARHAKLMSNVIVDPVEAERNKVYAQIEAAEANLRY